MGASQVKATNATLAVTADPANMIPRGEGCAQEYVAIDSYTTAAIEAASTITCHAIFPDGAYVTSIEVLYEDEAASATAAIGVTASADASISLDATKFLAQSAISSGPGILKANENMNTAIGGSQILLTTAGATLDGSALITVITRYVLK